MSSSRFRRVALALPGAIEGAHQGHADFRVGKRIFATLGYPDDDWGMVKLTPEQQSMLVEAEPEIFRPVPGGWGKHGSTNVRLAKADATTLQSALDDGVEQRRAEVTARSRARRTSDFAPHQFAIARIAHYLSVHPRRRLRLELSSLRFVGAHASATKQTTRRRIGCEGSRSSLCSRVCRCWPARRSPSTTGNTTTSPPDIRAWFKSVIAPNGVPCCDISDGHRTDYDVREGAYWVPIEGQWMAVPERAVIRDRGNPVGEAVVWYVHHRGSIIISCFVPADAV